MNITRRQLFKLGAQALGAKLANGVLPPLAAPTLPNVLGNPVVDVPTSKRDRPPFIELITSDRESPRVFILTYIENESFVNLQFKFVKIPLSDGIKNMYVVTKTSPGKETIEVEAYDDTTFCKCEAFSRLIGAGILKIKTQEKI